MRDLIGQGRLDLVPLGRRTFSERSPFRLPFRIVLVDPLPDALIGPLREEHWLDFASTAPHGVHVARKSLGDCVNLPRERGRIDLLIADVGAARRVLRTGSRAARSDLRPRLIAAVGTPSELRHEPRGALPGGVGLLLLPLSDRTPQAGDFLRHLMRAFVHDLPMHEAVQVAAKLARLHASRAPRLIADPGSNWSISISDDYSATVDQARSLLEASRSSIFRGSSLGRREELEDRFRYLDPGFEQETSGLKQLLDVHGTLDALKTAHERAVVFESAAPPPSVDGASRAVDIALERTAPVTGDVERDPRAPRRVLRNSALRAGGRYVICVQIGASFMGSLFATRPPPIDVLLPPCPEGHRLDVAVFGLDFDLESPAVVPMHLPAEGPSDVVTFRVRAPRRTEPESGRLRLVISYLDQILQSYVITARVADEERKTPEGITIQLEHCATKSFKNLGRFSARSACTIVNDDPVGGAHSLTFKRGGRTATFRFTEASIQKAAEELRSILAQTVGSGAPTFPEPPPTNPLLLATRTQNFEEVVRNLARRGMELHGALFAETNKGGRELLRDLRRTHDQTIQIVQTSASLNLPWNGVYDGWAPDNLAALDKVSAVCNGFDAQGARCGHDTNSTGVVCCRGFWGLRHRLEVLIGQDQTRDVIQDVKGFSSRLRVALGASTRGENKKVPFYQSANQTGVLILPKTDVHDLLWLAPERPGVLVALGHCELSSDKVTYRIDLDPELTDRGILNRNILNGEWDDPHTVVVLMACQSATTLLDTLLGMTKAFLSAGAGALLGAETNVFLEQAEHVAERICARLVDERMPLGEAMQQIRWDLVRGRNPLALTFVAFGSADLRVM